MVVEDDAAQRELLCELLEGHGDACITAEDARRALDVNAVASDRWRASPIAG